MSWRTVVVSNHCKLDTKMGYMVIRGEETKRIFLDEIAMVLIENPAVSLTGCLLEALNERKIHVIFCDKKRSPYAELVPYYGSGDCSGKIRRQIAWTALAKDTVWRQILANKIQKQADHLAARKCNREAILLESYVSQIAYQDQTNREGHAAKVYFNALFGMGFSRSQDSPINTALNYGYGILLSDAERMIAELSMLLPCSLNCTKLSIGTIWKANGIEIAEDYGDPLEKILDYMELVRDFDREKLFIFVNMRSYFPDDRLKMSFESALNHEFSILLIDGREYDRLEMERRVTIDKDLCEF